MSTILTFFPILFNGAPATMVNLSNMHFGVYCHQQEDSMAINLSLNQLTRIKTAANLNQVRIIYEPDKRLKPVEITFFSRNDRDEFLQNLIDAQLVDQAKCCYLYVPSFLLRSCCGLFRYNQLYVRKQLPTVTKGKKLLLKIKRKKISSRSEPQSEIITSPPPESLSIVSSLEKKSIDTKSA